MTLGYTTQRLHADCMKKQAVFDLIGWAPFGKKIVECGMGLK